MQLTRVQACSSPEQVSREVWKRSGHWSVGQGRGGVTSCRARGVKGQERLGGKGLEAWGQGPWKLKGRGLESFAGRGLEA
eukprot:3738098-Pleurochrysis_carterae.AAC.1